MAQISIVDYTADTIGELAAKMKAEHPWTEIVHEDDSTQWDFYVDEAKTQALRLYLSGNNIYIKVLFKGVEYTGLGSNTTHFTVKFILTASTFAMVIRTANVSVEPSATDTQIIITDVTNQQSGAGGTAIIVISGSGRNTTFYADDVVEPRSTSISTPTSNSRVTVIFPLYNERSYSIPQNIFFIVSSEVSATMTGRAALGDKKYYVHGMVWFIDE